MNAFQARIHKGLSKAFNLSVLQKSRWEWVDYLKGIAIILVVYRHVLLGIEKSGVVIPASLVNANMIFYSFRMPLFFILSGIFISSSLAKRTIGQLVSTKFENLLYPYLVWSFIQVTIQILLSNYTNSNRSLIDYTYILYQPRNLDQFWYLPALFNTSVIYLLVKTRLKLKNYWQLALGVLLFFLAPYFERISMISDWMAFYIFFALGDAIGPVFFKDRTQSFLKNPWSLVAIIPVFIAAQIYYLNHDVNKIEFLVIALIGCISMFIVAFRFQSWGILPFLRVLGFHSIYIYVMHVIIAGFVRAVLTKVIGIHNPEFLLGMGIFLGVTIPVIVYNLFIRDNFGWFLFSTHRPGTKKKKIAAQKSALTTV